MNDSNLINEFFLVDLFNEKNDNLDIPILLSILFKNKIKEFASWKFKIFNPELFNMGEVVKTQHDTSGNLKDLYNFLIFDNVTKERIESKIKSEDKRLNFFIKEICFDNTMIYLKLEAVDTSSGFYTQLVPLFYLNEPLKELGHERDKIAEINYLLAKKKPILSFDIISLSSEFTPNVFKNFYLGNNNYNSNNFNLDEIVLSNSFIDSLNNIWQKDQLNNIGVKNDFFIFNSFYFYFNYKCLLMKEDKLSFDFSNVFFQVMYFIKRMLSEKIYEVNEKDKFYLLDKYLQSFIANYKNALRNLFLFKKSFATENEQNDFFTNLLSQKIFLLNDKIEVLKKDEILDLYFLYKLTYDSKIENYWSPENEIFGLFFQTEESDLTNILKEEAYCKILPSNFHNSTLNELEDSLLEFLIKYK
jgi:hypothetical protein